jgi:hypothetical protein
MRSFSFCSLQTFSCTASKIIFAAALFLILPGATLAASLGFSHSSGTFEQGTTFSVGISAFPQGEALNAVSGEVSFPTDLLEVVSVTKSQSIISLWVVEPAFSNTAGTVNFEGIVLNPGYSGAAGRVINITFRAKAAGQANLAFAAGSILANDGEGTEILSSRGQTTFSITAPAVAPEEVVLNRHQPKWLQSGVIYHKWYPTPILKMVGQT